MKALEQPAFEDRAKFLKFLTTLNLINDKSLSNTIDSFLINQPQNIPYIAIPEISAASITDSSNLNKLREKEKVDKKIQDGDYEGAIKLDPANLIAYMRLIEKLVKDKDYSKAVTYFNSLVSSNKSGVGYSVYPDLIFAYDQIGNINQAGILIQQLRLRVNDDIKSGYGYYSHSQQIGWLKRDLEKDLNYFKNPSLKNSIGNLINELNGIILKLTT